MKMGKMEEALTNLAVSWNLNATLTEAARLQAVILR